jgi:hypothetical protein
VEQIIENKIYLRVERIVNIFTSCLSQLKALFDNKYFHGYIHPSSIGLFSSDYLRRDPSDVVTLKGVDLCRIQEEGVDLQEAKVKLINFVYAVSFSEIETYPKFANYYYLADWL